jgi:outer membrane protein W
MKKLITIAAMLFSAAQLFALSNPYVAIKGGYENSRQKYVYDHIGGDMFKARGYIAGAGAGAYLSERLRVELSYAHKNLNDKIWCRDESKKPVGGGCKGAIVQYGFFISAFYYLFQKTLITPFVGAGMGYGIVAGKGFYDYLPTKGNFAYVFYLGADYSMSNKLVVELAFNHNAILNPYDFPVKTTTIDNFGGLLGLRYSF